MRGVAPAIAGDQEFAFDFCGHGNRESGIGNRESGIGNGKSISRSPLRFPTAYSRFTASQTPQCFPRARCAGTCPSRPPRPA
ncbi:hypothetical protein FPK90_07460 [Xanthomonas citri pv. glycines]|nr:hypothetical protein FPK90_07460 [Xanthomonas citri pv. glycines]QDS19687.1 hypothetical protein FPL05_07855 [Xanthomonas citri pv. glycines]